jgi:hypothetical protein
MRAPRRRAAFLQHDTAVLRPPRTGADGLPMPATMIATLGLGGGGLDDRTWSGHGAFVDSVHAAAAGVSPTEAGLIAGLVVAGVLAIVGWAGLALLWYRGTRPREGLLPSIPLAEMWGAQEDTADKEERVALQQARSELASEEASDNAYLYSDSRSADRARQARLEAIDAKLKK